METEQVGTGFMAAEGAPPSAPASIVEPQPVEHVPDYPSRSEVLAMLDQVRAEAREHGQRGAQSFIDKARLNERMSVAERVLQQQIRDGMMDESQASTYRQRAQWEALTDLLPEQEPPRQSAPQMQPPADPLFAEADRLIKEAGITQADPEWATLQNQPSALHWGIAFERAKVARAARLARATAAANAQPTTPTPKPPPPAAPGVTAVEVGGGLSAPAGDPKSLQQQLIQAYRRNNRAEIDRINAEIERAVRSG